MQMRSSGTMPKSTCPWSGRFKEFRGLKRRKSLAHQTAAHPLTTACSSSGSTAQNKCNVSWSRPKQWRRWVTWPTSQPAEQRSWSARSKTEATPGRLERPTSYSSRSHLKCKRPLSSSENRGHLTARVPRLVHTLHRGLQEVGRFAIDDPGNRRVSID